MITGRPAFAPSDEQRTLVAELAACGVRQEIIARRIVGAPLLPLVPRNPIAEGVSDEDAARAYMKFINGAAGESQ
jgi:hypothetical protein